MKYDYSIEEKIMASHIHTEWFCTEDPPIPNYSLLICVDCGFSKEYVPFETSSSNKTYVIACRV